jgi:translation initiation factor IF-2
MRVYELAKQLGMENRDLIPELKRMGIAVASHSSALEEESVQKVLAKLGPKSKTSAKPSGHVAESGHDRTQRGKDTGHGPTAKTGGGHVAPAAEEPKPDKRRILIKRKKAEEGVAKKERRLLSELSRPVSSPQFQNPQALSR